MSAVNGTVNTAKEAIDAFVEACAQHGVDPYEASDDLRVFLGMCRGSGLEPVAVVRSEH